MNNLYIFSIGGSGAKCLESLVYLCAAGLGTKELYPIMIDPDQDNGNLNRTTSLIKEYRKIRSLFNEPGEKSFFYTDIKELQYWNPLTRRNEDSKAKTLKQILNFNELEDKEKLLASLLFSSNQLELDLEYGFRGVPSIGAVVMHSIQEQDFYKEKTHSLSSNETNKAFVFASIFGGTGAAGYPVITKLLKNHPNKVGGVVLTPYFYLKSPHHIIDPIRPDSSTFINNTIGALPFYQKDVKIDCNYILGDVETQQLDNYSIGGREQNNKAHFIELISALAAIDFCKTDSKDVEKFKVLKVSKPIKDNSKDLSITFKDLPLDEDGKNLLLKFGLFINSYRSLFKSVNSTELDEYLYLISWLKNKLEINRNVLKQIKPELILVYQFLEKFVVWHNEMTHNNQPLRMFHDHFEFKYLVLDEENSFKAKYEDELDSYYLKSAEGQKINYIEKIITTMNNGIEKFLKENEV